MKKLLLFIFILLLNFYLSVLSNAFGQTVFSKDSVLNKLVKLKEETHVKALIADIRIKDKEILSIALGESMTNVPANTEMHLRIGGVTETFLGTLLMILVDQKKINLNDKISKWLPDLLAAETVTVGMLIKNTAGYKDYVLNPEFVDLITKEPFRYISRSEIITYSTSDGKLNFSPGTDQRYSHSEFTILGEILERATGKSMSELYEENIFSPLGLTQTGYCFNPELPSPVLHAFSSDRGIYEEATFWNPSWTGESGSLYSAINDLGKWAQIFGKGKLLSQESFNELVSRAEGVGKPELYFASGFGVAGGWYIQNPSFNGYSGAFGYIPSEELSIVIYTTQSEDPGSDSKAFEIFKELVKMITPENTINFKN